MCDGAARGNPGPAGIGAAVLTPEGEVLAEIAEGIGETTNNVAEYTAALEGLRRAADLGATDALLRSDSRLMIEQLAGRFRVKAAHLSPCRRPCSSRRCGCARSATSTSHASGTRTPTGSRTRASTPGSHGGCPERRVSSLRRSRPGGRGRGDAFEESPDSEGQGAGESQAGATSRTAQQRADRRASAR